MKPVTIPQHFWDSLGPERQAEVVRFEREFGAVWATGSRVICPSSVHTESDWDIYALGSKAVSKDLAWSEGYQQPGKKAASMAERSVSLKKNGLNLILFFFEYELKKFHEATEFCVSLGGPATRDDRIKMFRKVMGLRDRQDFEVQASTPKWDPAKKKYGRLEDRVQRTLEHVNTHLDSDTWTDIGTKVPKYAPMMIDKKAPKIDAANELEPPF